MTPAGNGAAERAKSGGECERSVVGSERWGDMGKCRERRWNSGARSSEESCSGGVGSYMHDDQHKQTNKGDKSSGVGLLLLVPMEVCD